MSCVLRISGKEADFDAYAMQKAEATNFLQAHHGTIKELVEFRGVDHAVLDLGVTIGEETFAKFCHLPRILVALAAGLSIEVSCYKTSDSEEGE